MASTKPTVLVTGASKGIGLAVTQYLLDKFQANVVAISRAPTPELNALKSEALLHIQCDIADEQSLTSAVSVAVDTYGSIDAVVLNAGTLEPLCRIGDNTPLPLWKKHFDVNFFSLVTAVKTTLPHLRKSPLRGRIVFVSSGAAVKGTAGWGPYNASKAAMNSLCRTLSEEEPDVISVSVRPGMVDTGMQEILRQTGATHMSKAQHDVFLGAHADGKLVKPEDCGHVIAALSLEAPPELSGEFVSWDSEECRAFRRK
ncbi:NAD(P)-binding protein [Macrolepiota fuliginosa MF-IS2]|uniref:NAD(P)-binding protein n=1 Tax=Macrolepiota fuliginosa MF-IS2 TaxID=1400762 RepID=A0A9P6C2R1_9AGAR|nr:NAD(P)-binding protein [Macrolepiota fuliginosa MF-IS2]